MSECGLGEWVFAPVALGPLSEPEVHLLPTLPPLPRTDPRHFLVEAATILVEEVCPVFSYQGPASSAPTSINSTSPISYHHLSLIPGPNPLKLLFTQVFPQQGQIYTLQTLGDPHPVDLLVIFDELNDLSGYLSIDVVGHIYLQWDIGELALLDLLYREGLVRNESGSIPRPVFAPRSGGGGSPLTPTNRVGNSCIFHFLIRNFIPLLDPHGYLVEGRGFFGVVVSQISVNFLFYQKMRFPRFRQFLKPPTYLLQVGINLLKRDILLTKDHVQDLLSNFLANRRKTSIIELEALDLLFEDRHSPWVSKHASEVYDGLAGVPLLLAEHHTGVDTVDTYFDVPLALLTVYAVHQIHSDLDPLPEVGSPRRNHHRVRIPVNHLEVRAYRLYQIFEERPPKGSDQSGHRLAEESRGFGPQTPVDCVGHDFVGLLFYVELVF